MNTTLMTDTFSYPHLLVLNDSSQEEVSIRDIRILPNLNASYLPMMPDGSVLLVDNVWYMSKTHLCIFILVTLYEARTLPWAWHSSWFLSFCSHQSGEVGMASFCRVDSLASHLPSMLSTLEEQDFLFQLHLNEIPNDDSNEVLIMLLSHQHVAVFWRVVFIFILGSGGSLDCCASVVNSQDAFYQLYLYTLQVRSKGRTQGTVKLKFSTTWYSLFLSTSPGYPASAWIARGSSWPLAVQVLSGWRNTLRSSMLCSITCRTSLPFGSSGLRTVSALFVSEWQSPVIHSTSCITVSRMFVNVCV